MAKKKCNCLENKLTCSCKCPHMKGGKMKSRLIHTFIKTTYENKPNEIEGYKLDKALSTEYVTVYWNDTLKHGVVSVRPTDSLRDVLSDIKAAVNLFKNDKRFTSNWSTLTKAGRKYGYQNLTAIAYSLGAIVLSHYKNVELFKEVFLISLPVLPVDIWKGNKVPSNATEIRSKLDATSLLKPWQDEGVHKTELVTAKSINPIKEHKASNIFKRIDPEKEIGFGNLNKMKVDELKSSIKKLRKGKAKQYPLSKKNKKELVAMLQELMTN